MLFPAARRLPLIWLRALAVCAFLLPVVSSGQRKDRTDDRPGPRGRFIVGSVVNTDTNSITVRSHSGEEQKLAVDRDTKFFRETPVTSRELRVGDSVIILGDSGDNTTSRPTRLIVQDADTRRPGPRASIPAGGPTFGVITDTDPLTVQLSSGETRKVELKTEESVIKQKQAHPSDITSGTFVRVLRDPRGNAATRVIMSSEGAGAGSAPVVEKTELLADIPRQTVDSDFIYGLWLGRGRFTNAELDRAFRVASNLGVRYLKVEFKWGYVEPENNKWRLNDENYLDVDHLITLAKKHDMSIIPYFDLFMPWGERKKLDPEKDYFEGLLSSRGQHQAPDSNEYADYVFTVVDTLVSSGVHVKYVELDNEDSIHSDGRRSYSSFININARQMKLAENAAYDRIKARHPGIMVSSTTFAFPGFPVRADEDVAEKRKERLNQFIKVYFGEDPKPKFDFLGIHETLGGSGNPYTTSVKPANAKYRWNFGSYNDAYDMWRDVLDSYGYENTPIFNTESGATLKNRQAIELIQRNIFSRANATKNKVIGCVVSQLTGSKVFTEGSKKVHSCVGITRLGDDYRLREGYFGYHILISMMRKYPIYSGKISGKPDTAEAWIESFSDSNGNRLYVAFIPYQFGPAAPKEAGIELKPGKEAVIARAGEPPSVLVGDADGRILLTVTDQPVFIELPPEH
jgi:hypothetical protein